MVEVKEVLQQRLNLIKSNVQFCEEKKSFTRKPKTIGFGSYSARNNDFWTEYYKNIGINDDRLLKKK